MGGGGGGGTGGQLVGVRSAEAVEVWSELLALQAFKSPAAAQPTSPPYQSARPEMPGSKRGMCWCRGGFLDQLEDHERVPRKVRIDYSTG